MYEVDIWEQLDQELCSFIFAHMISASQIQPKNDFVDCDSLNRLCGLSPSNNSFVLNKTMMSQICIIMPPNLMWGRLHFPFLK